MDSLEIEKDLLTFSKQDLNTLYNYYKVDNISSLAFQIYKKSSLPAGTIFDAINNNNFNDFMEFLNDPKFNPNVRYLSHYNSTILIQCLYNIQKNGKKYIEELLKKEPDLNLKNDKGITALIVACKFSEEIVNILISSGARLNEQTNNGWTALMHSVKNIDIVKILISAGARVDIQDNKGRTALQIASGGLFSNHTEETVAELIAAGADLDLQDSNGVTALMSAASMSKKYSTEETVRLLIDAGANLDLQNNLGWTALLLATSNSNSGMSSPETVKMLIDAGADPNIKNFENQIAIELTDDFPLQLLLLKAGSEISANKPKLIKFKIEELKAGIAKYKKLLDDLELNLLKDNKTCWSLTTGRDNPDHNSIKDVQDLKNCLKSIKTMIKLRPGGKKAEKMGKRYIRKFKEIEKTKTSE